MSDLTIEQINEAFQSNEELKGQFIQNFRESEDGQTLLNNHAENHWNSKIGDEIGSLHGKYDNDFKEVLGVDKPDGVKSYTFWKEQVQRLKESSNPELIAEKEAQIAELQKAVEQNSGSEHFKGLYEKLQSDSEARIAELTGQIGEFENKFRANKIESLIGKAMSGFEFNTELPEDVRTNYIDSIVSGLIGNAKVMEDGTVTFYENNEPILDPKTLAKMDAGQILKSKLASVLLKKDSSNGGGVDKDKLNPTDPNRLNVSATITTAKTQTQLYDAISKELSAKGMKKGSTEYTKEFDGLFAEHSKGLPLS
jgi:hypothetical protein